MRHLLRNYDDSSDVLLIHFTNSSICIELSRDLVLIIVLLLHPIRILTFLRLDEPIDMKKMARSGWMRTSVDQGGWHSLG